MQISIELEAADLVRVSNVELGMLVASAQSLQDLGHKAEIMSARGGAEMEVHV